MLDGMEELTLEVILLIPFIWFRCKVCFKEFSVIEYTYVTCFKVAMWFDGFYGLLGNNVFRTFSNIKDGVFCENSYLQWDKPSCLDIGKGSEHASAECKVNCFAVFLHYILCLKPYFVYFAISVQLDIHSKP